MLLQYSFCLVHLRHKEPRVYLIIIIIFSLSVYPRSTFDFFTTEIRAVFLYLCIIGYANEHTQFQTSLSSHNCFFFFASELNQMLTEQLSPNQNVSQNNRKTISVRHFDHNIVVCLHSPFHGLRLRFRYDQGYLSISSRTENANTDNGRPPMFTIKVQEVIDNPGMSAYRWSSHQKSVTAFSKFLRSCDVY